MDMHVHYWDQQLCRVWLLCQTCMLWSASSIINPFYPVLIIIQCKVNYNIDTVLYYKF